MVTAALLAETAAQTGSDSRIHLKVPIPRVLSRQDEWKARGDVVSSDGTPRPRRARGRLLEAGSVREQPDHLLQSLNELRGVVRPYRLREVWIAMGIWEK